MPTIAHISDLHLQSGSPARQAQVEPILKKINAMKPDLVVISGDVTDDGWDSDEELSWARRWLDERIGSDWFAIPGNHDVGNFVSLPEGQITTERVDRWARWFDQTPARRFDNPSQPSTPPSAGWYIIGLNSMLLGSGLKRERQLLNERYGEVSWTNRESFHTAVFIHSPIFIKNPSEKTAKEAEYWLGPTRERKSFPLVGINLLGSGHVHQTRLTEVDGVTIAWAPPASGTWVHAPGLPNPPMPEQTGFFMHTLHDDGRVDSELIECAPMLKLYEHNPWP